MRTMPYSLYRTGYSEYPASNYNPRTKTIDVELPDHKRPRFPADWIRSGNHYITPNGCTVTFWSSGLAENFLVEHGYRSKTFHASMYVREMVIDYVRSVC